MGRSRFLASYDISDDRRRDKVHRTLRDFGDQLQFSVFLCELNPREAVSLRSRLTEIVNLREDQIVFVKLGRCDENIALQMEWVGRRVAESERVVVV
jgi:CRISPR-associated protein Cas2